MVQSKFNYTIEGNKLRIVDLNGRRTVTNDMENVLAFIHKQEKKDLSGWNVMYKDSMGDWSGVTCKNTGTLENPDYEVKF